MSEDADRTREELALLAVLQAEELHLRPPVPAEHDASFGFRIGEYEEWERRYREQLKAGETQADRVRRARIRRYALGDGYEEEEDEGDED